MEEVFCKTTCTEIENETISLKVDREGLFNSKVTYSPNDISSVKDENSEVEIREETNEELNGQIGPEALSNFESSKVSEFVTQKTFSPTLIESAFKVVKNLFSPDKTKSKSTGVLNPINQPKSASGSPHSSTYIPGKAELFPLELETEIQNNIQPVPGEYSLKNFLHNNDLGVVQSPLTLDLLDNTDESFLTTVSLIDESFHSAVTYFDEQADTLKNGANLSENILNNSRNLNLLDAYNDTLENNDSCSENTTLKINSFLSEGSESNNISIQSKDGIMENLNDTQVSCKNLHLDDPEKISVNEIQCEIPKENLCNASARNEEEFRNEILKISEKNDLEEECIQGVSPRKNTSAMTLLTDTSTEINNTFESSEKALIYLSDSFVQPVASKQIEICENSYPSTVEGEKQNFSEIKTENEIHPEVSNIEQDGFVENSISTTTVVLSTVDSVDLENMLMSLKADDSGTNTSSLTSFEGDDAICSLENVTEKPPSKEQLDSSLLVGQTSGNSSAAEENFPLTEEQKYSVSDGDFQINRLDCTINKLNDDELIDCRISAESYERNKELDNEKTSVGISLSKNSEASEIPKELHPDSYAKVIEISKERNESEIGKTEINLPPNKPDAVSVISQQSYTILTVNDNSLNRPVIEPLNISGGSLSEKQAFHMNQSGATLFTESENSEKCFVSNCSNASFGTEDVVKSSQPKQSTPLWEGHTESTQKNLRPTLLKLYSPELEGPIHSDKRGIEKNADSTKPDLFVKGKQIFSINEAPAGLSPVNPVINDFAFSNSTEDELGEILNDLQTTKILSPKDAERDELNQDFGTKSGLNKSKKLSDDTKETPSTIRASNQTFKNKQNSPGSKNVKQAVHKKAESPPTHKLNQTFEKKSKSPACDSRNVFDKQDTPGHNRTNLPCDKNQNSPKSNKKKKSKSPEIEKANQTFSRPQSPGLTQLNKTFDKQTTNKQLNQTFEKKADYPGPQKINETFDKRSESPLRGKINEPEGKTLEFSPHDKTDKTFVKEKDFNNSHQGKKAQEMNMTFVSVDMYSAAKECEASLALETEVDDKLSQGNQNCGIKDKISDSPDSFFDEGQTYLSSNFLPSECLDYRTNKTFELDSNKDINESFASAKSADTSLACSDLSTVLPSEEELCGNQSIDLLSGKLRKMNLNENSTDLNVSVLRESVEPNLGNEEKLLSSRENEKFKCDLDLVQLIQEQFSSNDIEKICSVVQDLSSMKLSSDILKASEQFGKSCHGDLSDAEFKLSELEAKSDKTMNTLSPQSLDFLNSIRGKPTGRDLSRESLYVKFDPLVQPSANSLIDFTKEGEAIATTDASPVTSHSSNICEKLLTISPQKKPDDIVPPLTPLSHKNKTGVSEDKIEKLRELQNEIYFLKNLYAERERSNKAKMEDYESQIAKLTGENCMLEDKLKESNEREKSLVKKMKEQTQSIGQLKIIMEEYVKVISKLTSELQTIKNENGKQMETLSLEKDSYMTHLQNTEAAFTDVHAKYEKSKKTIVSLKANEVMYKNTIQEQSQKMEDFKIRAKEAQEKALIGFQKIQEELNETRTSQAQETARLKAQLRKTELKVQALQESLDQKIKENQQLTAICDELIEGKK